MARVALVTGGTRGIGSAISVALKVAGRHVVASYAGNDHAAHAFSEATGIATLKFDAGDFAQCQDSVAKIHADHGPIEILVNNAGITRDATMARMTRDMWDAVVDTNLGSCFNLCKLTFDDMRAKKFGRVVNVGSINGQAGQYGQVNYAAAKSGIHGFTKALAQEARASALPSMPSRQAMSIPTWCARYRKMCCKKLSPKSRWDGLATPRTSRAALCS